MYVHMSVHTLCSTRLNRARSAYSSDCQSWLSICVVSGFGQYGCCCQYRFGAARQEGDVQGGGHIIRRVVVRVAEFTSIGKHQGGYACIPEPGMVAAAQVRRDLLLLEGERGGTGHRIQPAVEHRPRRLGDDAHPLGGVHRPVPGRVAVRSRLTPAP